MPNGGQERWQHELEEIIHPHREDGWEYHFEDPDWVLSAAPDELFKPAKGGFKYDTFVGDRFVYKVTSPMHGGKPHVFRKLKSDYFETTPEEGTCPNCQSYVKRYDDDDYLTCHRCGWQYKPLRERVKNWLSL